MKMKGIITRGKSATGQIGMVLLTGLVFLVMSCEKEADSQDYGNVNRTMALDDLEKVLRGSVTEIGSVATLNLQARASAGQKAAQESEPAIQKFKMAMKPAMTQSKKLLSTYGISEAYMAREFNELDDPRIILTALWFMSAERQSKANPHRNRAQFLELDFFAQETSLTEAQPDWLECMMVAVGVDAIVEFAKGNITQALAKKAIRKIASRVLGWVGVALALYEYGNCMGWY